MCKGSGGGLWSAAAAIGENCGSWGDAISPRTLADTRTRAPLRASNGAGSGARRAGGHDNAAGYPAQNREHFGGSRTGGGQRLASVDDDEDDRLRTRLLYSVSLFPFSIRNTARHSHSHPRAANSGSTAIENHFQMTSPRGHFSAGQPPCPPEFLGYCCLIYRADGDFPCFCRIRYNGRPS